jgi:carboxymethylenebutenolidase
VPGTTDAMKAAGKVYDPVTYDGAGHGFMRAGEDPSNTNPANKTARDQGFARLVKLLHEMKSAHAAAPAPRPNRLAKTAPGKPCHEPAYARAGI